MSFLLFLPLFRPWFGFLSSFIFMYFFFLHLLFSSFVLLSVMWRCLECVFWRRCQLLRLYRGADKSLARPGRKQATATKLELFCKSLKKIQKVVRPTRSPRQQWPPRRTKNGDLSIVFFSRVGLRTYQHLCIILTIMLQLPTVFSTVTCWTCL